MARITRADLLSQDPGEGAQIIEALAPLATGVNEDGTHFTMPTTGMLSKWRDEFSGSSIKSDDWTVVTANGGTATVSGSNLVLATGTANNGAVEITSKRTYTPGVRLYAVLSSISQRIANQNLQIGLVEESAASHSWGTDHAIWVFNGTSATAGQLLTASQGDAGATVTQGSLTNTAGASVFEVDLGHEEVWFYNTPADVNTGRSASVRLARKVPDPNKRYRVRIRAANAGATSNTNFNIDSILVEDYSFVPVEISRGRGSTTQGEAMAVQLVGAGSVTLGGATTASPANLSATDAVASLTITQGQTDEATFLLSGTWAGTVNFEWMDSSGTWRALPTVSATSGSWVGASTTSNGAYRGAIPAGATQLRARINPYTSGTAVVAIAAGRMGREPLVNVQGGSVALNPGTSIIGRIIQDARYWVETPTATLAAGATWNGAGRDVWGTASGNAPGAGSYPARFRAHSRADQAHTLLIECSDDNTNWDPIGQQASISMANTNVCNVDVPCVTRYMRAVIFNGSASAFTLARCRTSAVAV